MERLVCQELLDKMAAIGHCGEEEERNCQSSKEYYSCISCPFLIVTAEPCQANYRILIETDQYRQK